MDPLTILTLICVFAIVTLVVSDYRDCHEDDDASLNSDSSGVPAQAGRPIPLNRGPHDVA